MGSESSALKAQLVEALQSLCKTLTSGPEQIPHGGTRFAGDDWTKIPLAVAIKKVRWLLRGGEKPVPALVDDSIAPRRCC